LPQDCFPAFRDRFRVCEFLSQHHPGGTRRSRTSKSRKEPGFGAVTFDNASFDRRVDRTGIILLILASGITFFLYSGRAALSLAVGGVLSTVNFHWLKQAVDFVIIKGGSGPVGKRV